MAATAFDGRPTELAAQKRVLISHSTFSSSISSESLHSTNSYRARLMKGVCRMPLQPRRRIGASKQFVRAANQRIKKLLCGFDALECNADDTIPLIDQSFERHSSEDKELEANPAFRNETEATFEIKFGSSPQRSDQSQRFATGGGSAALRKSFSTSTIDALSVEIEQRKRADRPTSIQLRSTSAAPRARWCDATSTERRGGLAEPKPSPVTTDADDVRYVTAFLSDDFLAPPEQVGSLIKAIYGIVRNPPQCDAETRGKTIKLRLKVTIHPNDSRKATATPDTPGTSSSSTRAVAEGGNRSSGRTTTACRTYPPYPSKTTRKKSRRCRHAMQRNTVSIENSNQVYQIAGQQELMPARSRITANQAAQEALITTYAARLNRNRHRYSSHALKKSEHAIVVHETIDSARHENASEPKECRHGVVRTRGIPATDRIQNVLDWLNKTGNDFCATSLHAETMETRYKPCNIGGGVDVEIGQKQSSDSASAKCARHMSALMNDGCVGATVQY